MLCGSETALLYLIPRGQKPTRHRSVLDNIWTNISALLCIIGTFDHCTVLLAPSVNSRIDKYVTEYVSTRCMAHKKKILFASHEIVSKVKWKPIFHMDNCFCITGVL